MTGADDLKGSHSSVVGARRLLYSVTRIFSPHRAKKETFYYSFMHTTKLCCALKCLSVNNGSL